MALRFGCRCDSYKLQHFPVFAPAFKEIVVNADDTVEEKMVPSNRKIPDVESFELENILKAGIPLQQTNTKVIQSDFGAFVEVANSDGFEVEEEAPVEPETQTTQTKE